jgi:hypothetical protein
VSSGGDKSLEGLDCTLFGAFELGLLVLLLESLLVKLDQLLQLPLLGEQSLDFLASLFSKEKARGT